MKLPLPLLTAGLALLGALGSTVFLYREATHAVDTVLDQRLSGAGTAAALLVKAEHLEALAAAENLDGAFLVDPALKVLGDTNGPAGRAADLLRVDPERVTLALAGHPTIGHGYDLAGVKVRTGYFPVRENGAVVAVLGLEAGALFSNAGGQLQRALGISAALALLGALALALLASRQVKSDRQREQALAKAERGELLTRVAATAAHEIRNPLAVIRGTVELMQERSGASQGDKDRAALRDVLGEVDRLKQLTDDLLELSADRALQLGPVEVDLLLEELLLGMRAASPQATFTLSGEGGAPVQADGHRLRQVFLNLLRNAVQAAPSGTISISIQRDAAGVKVTVADDGPGVSPEIAARLFEPFATSRSEGTGLGLAVSRRFVERHGGQLRLVPSARGACFEVLLPGTVPS